MNLFYDYYYLFKDTVAHIKKRHIGFYCASTGAQDVGENRENLIEQGRLEERARNNDLLSEYRAYVQTIPANCINLHIDDQPPFDADTHQNLLPADSQDSSFDDALRQAFAIFDQNPG